MHLSFIKALILFFIPPQTMIHASAPTKSSSKNRFNPIRRSQGMIFGPLNQHESAQNESKSIIKYPYGPRMSHEHYLGALAEEEAKKEAIIIAIQANKEEAKIKAQKEALTIAQYRLRPQ